VSEVDENGDVLATFTYTHHAGMVPWHLSIDSRGHVLVADPNNDRILLLTSKLHLERVLVDTNSQTKLLKPRRVHYNELTSVLYVAHVSSDWLPGSLSTDKLLPYVNSQISL